MKKEFCCTNGHVNYAGTHLIIELWNAQKLTEEEPIKEILTAAVKACNATLLSLELHKFSPEGGVSGVGILQESHISIHTWPEYQYAAMDIFVCGTVNPYEAVPIIKDGFHPEHVQITELKRGIF
ncbi:MAG: adenosylmethionine decarboxylase [Candidatus Omnitrophica bacterium]|nr:adenosylmethionine decarboxylase [Candidatus Omnitrophota bacterium]